MSLTVEFASSDEATAVLLAAEAGIGQAFGDRDAALTGMDKLRQSIDKSEQGS